MLTVQKGDKIFESAYTGKYAGGYITVFTIDKRTGKPFDLPVHGMREWIRRKRAIHEAQLVKSFLTAR